MPLVVAPDLPTLSLFCLDHVWDHKLIPDSQTFVRFELVDETGLGKEDRLDKKVL